MKTRKLLIALVLGMGTATAWAGETEERPLYKDSLAPIESRVEDLLRRMTLHEKTLQLQNRPVGRIDEIESIFQGQSYGCTHEMGKTAEECAGIYNELQKYMLTKTRLGIPILTAVEGIQGILQNNSTLFPHSIAQGSTFNPELIERMTDAAGKEAAAMGIHQVLSPVFDIARELRWGRVEETYGEDPFLISEMGIGFVKGYQKHQITCTPKHFVAHGTPAGGLNCAFVSGGEREFRSIYLYPFARVIKETNPLCIMSCYSAYDGIPVSASPYYMTDVLRDELGFKGYVYSDWGSVGRVMTFHYAVPTREEAAKVSLIAGVDLDVDSDYETLEQQVKEGKIDEAYIDKAVRRVLYVKFALGLFDRPYYGDPKLVKKVVRSDKHIALAKEVADESTILLENKNNILPLDLSKYKSIAVVGPNSNQTVFGDYSWTTPDTKEGVTLYQGLQQVLGKKKTILQADGCNWWNRADSKDIEQAVKAVEQSDLAIVAVGTRSTFLGRGPRYSTAGEGFDLSSLELPGNQSELLKAVKATGKPMIVVLISGKPLVMSWAKENADAVLVQWYAGEQQGRSLADILVGNVNPSGRVNVSFPRSTGNTPCFYNYYPTDRVQRFDRPGTYEEPAGHYIFEHPYALWEFGYGLSYTNFNYSGCTLNDSIYSDQGTIVATVEVENTGKRDGKEVVQLYVRDKISSVSTPIKQLKAFKKVFIKAGEKKIVTLEVPMSELALYDVRMKPVVEPGEFEIQIGSSSDRIHFNKTILVK
ncbi:glycosyl hydrolase [Bacteroides salyersiae]|jgi:periplasmic beta-glucosidase|uniref:glycoside hydrolase family 3 N-terminal domain-containing protein n=4 Tax=Bacteroides salyersiae TaxID=291644 RepID=UPI00125E8172|nr:glycoside hydrolase family 3 N-terminal domain-containing protein [Bacteroides salyersiae]KAB5349408.1 glycosyl hydrolase [Bacteroides salyersiae]KAB5351380.1 glycosyl hydrolase [Bacteroides salyersiae]KAB5370986.1 glycosyl hydrolase [Bacteroides salyersiae]KAB5377414.1 glycosyl hydrolase [Bacteroides salyersiae]KAB5386744.1 glycosyl hydrolase [Bacteroides salyersiae]